MQVWKAELSAAEKQRKYDEAYARTAELLPELNQALVQLEQLIYSQVGAHSLESWQCNFAYL